MANEIKRSAADILQEAANTYRERNKIYGDNYKNVGKVMINLHPNGIELKTDEDFTLFHLWELVIVKLTRFANSGLSHIDSIHDAAVYCAMIQEILEEEGKPGGGT
jgi:hypothetical protein